MAKGCTDWLTDPSEGKLMPCSRVGLICVGAGSSRTINAFGALLRFHILLLAIIVGEKYCCCHNKRYAIVCNIFISTVFFCDVSLASCAHAGDVLLVSRALARESRSYHGQMFVENSACVFARASCDVTL